MKKLFLFMFVLIACLLVGCGSTAKITTIDPETGEKGTYKIEATDNEDEVIEAIYNMSMSNVKVDSYQTESLDLTFKIGIDNGESGAAEIKIDLNGNINFKMGLDKEVEISNVKSIIDAIMASGKIGFDGNFSNGGQEKNLKLDLEMFLEKGTLYFMPSFNQEIINTLSLMDPQYSETAKLLNNSWLKYNISEIIPQEYLDFDMMLGSDETIADILEANNINKEDLRTLIENIVKEYNVTISKVKSNVVTLKASVNDIYDIELSIDTKKMSAVGVKVAFDQDSDNMNISMDIDAKISYKSSAEKISEENKLKAVDLNALANMFTGSSDIASTDELIEYANKLRYIRDYEIVEQGTPNFEVPAGGYDGSEVTITFYHTMGQRLTDVLNPYIEDFNKIYPNIHIEHMQVGGYDDVRNMISTELLIGKSPNVAYCYPDHVVKYNKTDSVVVLDALAFSGESDGAGGMLALGANDPNIIDGDEGRRYGDGQLYSLPLLKSMDLMYYNKTFFDTYGISVPDHWFSTDENDTTSMEAVIKMIKLIDPNCIPLGCDSESNLFINMCAQIGSDYTSNDSKNHYLFNNSYNKGFMSVFHDWYQNGLMTTSTLYGAYTSGLFTNRDSGRQNCYISIASSSNAIHELPNKENGAYPFEVGIAPIPQMSIQYKRVVTQGPSLCIFKKDNPQEVIASWLFVKYLVTSLDFQAEFSMASGYMPILRNIKNNKMYKEFLDRANGYDFVQALANKVCLEQEWSYFTPAAFDGSENAKNVIKNLFTAVLTANNSNFKERINELFANAEKACKQN